MNHSSSSSSSSSSSRQVCHVIEFGAGAIADNGASSGTTLPAGTW
ncbi:hypothetical protein [Streptomyces sp. NRRL WC-3618]|nr:hypothetical protein [Streptomyces sp. NRRL WC-3618]